MYAMQAAPAAEVPATAEAPPTAEAAPKVQTPPAAKARPAPAQAPRVKEGFMVIPSIGINSFQGDSGEGTGVGLRVGLLAGGRLGRRRGRHCRLGHGGRRRGLGLAAAGQADDGGEGDGGGGALSQEVAAGLGHQGTIGHGDCSGQGVRPARGRAGMKSLARKP